MMNRREFLQNTAVLSLVSLASRSAFAQNSSVRLKIIVFWEEGFPMLDGFEISKDVLQEALSEHDLGFANSAELSAKLAGNIDLFVNPYGSAFPRDAWPTILKYLQTGGNFLNLGGVPFAVPVKDRKNQTRQVNFHKRLGILQVFETDGAVGFRSKSETLKNFAENAKVEKCFALYPRLTTKVDFPEDSGSDGAREAQMSALVHGLDQQNQPINAPVVLLDRRQGEFAGGRWIFATFKGSISTSLIKILAETAAFGALDFSVKTDFACYRAGETPCLRIFADNPRAKGEIWTNGLLIEVSDATGAKVFSSAMKIERRKNSPIEVEIELAPDALRYQAGFYKVRVTSNFTKQKNVSKISAETGFWFMDEKLLAAGAKFTADRHFLYRNGAPFPVVGTSYMASDVHRRFLLEPNGAVWDKDFAEMKSAGVNMIRTGIWTGWKLYFDAQGNVREEILRAFEAFVLTAKRYDIPVIFTFFAFMPEMFGGRNAYLDPKSVEAQKRFLQAFARRAELVSDLIWDLINEPSFANPKALWSCRPNYDEFERMAWKEWLKQRFNEPDETVLAEILRDKWRLTHEENPFDLPRSEDFESVNIFSNRRPLKALEFRLFAQDTFENWTRELSKTLKAAGNAAQMVTVGQDEAGTGDSPSPQFHADSVDFTCLHNWWSNDDLLWDNVVSKAPQKPNMIQETGVMFYEKTDGAAWRDERTTAELLERKMALALGANACGFIEWIWNTNPFMNIDNEAGIGFLRVDESRKPEFFAFQKIARFANENRAFFQNQRDARALLVIPHSAQFTPRNFASEATKKAVRTFHYHLRQALQAVSEYNLEAITETPALIIVPSPRVLTDAAWENLQRLAGRGAVVAVTGFIEENEHLQPRTRIGASFQIGGARPVAQFENISIDGKNHRVRFAGEKIQRVEKAATTENIIRTLKIGAGEIVWSPLPLEIGETLEPVAAFYDFAVRRARLTPVFKLKNDNPAILVRPTEFEKAFLYLVVNESSADEKIELTHSANGAKTEFILPAGQTKLFFVEK